MIHPIDISKKFAIKMRKYHIRYAYIFSWPLDNLGVWDIIVDGQQFDSVGSCAVACIILYLNGEVYGSY